MTFPSYLEVSPRVPHAVWRTLRITTILATLLLVVLLLVEPTSGLHLFWRVAIPVLPAVFFFAPGVWRNVCPLAAVNQIPRLTGLTRGLALPDPGHRYAYLVGVGALLTIVPARKPLLEGSGVATAVLVVSALGLAFLGGLVFRGKSGWCGSVCPLLPVQRLYGQAPFAPVRNDHCSTCLGCTVNCYDFNPRVAQVADLHDEARGPYRQLFAGLFPGLVVGFFATPAGASWAEAYGTVALAAAVSLGIVAAADALLRPPPALLTAACGAVALNLFYGYVVVARATDSGWVVWPQRVALAAISLVWLIRVHRTEQEVERRVSSETAQLDPLAAATLRGAGTNEGEVAVGGHRVVVPVGTTVLEVLERNGLPIQSGCRMGVCGADPVTVVTGDDALTPVTAAERATIERLGLGPRTRLACCARVAGAVEVSLETTAAGAKSDAGRVFHVTSEIERVVIIGNGIAGVTAADHVRRHHADCAIDMVARERYHLYNRMAITKLIYGHAGLRGLYLMSEDWYDERDITVRLTTTVEAVDLEKKHVLVATGEIIPYDRLILTAGSSGAAPPIDGFDKRGVFVLRTADDAMAIREDLQTHHARSAVVLGGGLLGLEAAFALHKIGLGVTVINRGAQLLDRQLDAAAAVYLKEYLEGVGLEFVLSSGITEVTGNGRVSAVVLADGSSLDTDIVLAAVGIAANLDIPRQAGLDVGRGVLVDDRMQTSDPFVFAAGDVAEHSSGALGLWPVAVEQARVAALNALGGDEVYEPKPPITMLKVTGVDLASVGAIATSEPGDEEIVVEEPTEGVYRKVVLREGRAIGGIVLGSEGDAPPLLAVVQEGRDLTPVLERLRQGDWGALSD